MKPVPVELSEDDRRFAEEHNLNLESLVANAIQRKRRQHEYENPTAELTDGAVDLITHVHTAAIEDDLYSGQQSLTPRRLTVAARPHIPKEGQYTLTISMREVNRLNGAEINDTMRGSGAFLAEVSRNVREVLADLNETDSENFVFVLDGSEVDEYSGRKRATYNLVVDPSDFEG